MGLTNTIEQRIVSEKEYLTDWLIEYFTKDLASPQIGALSRYYFPELVSERAAKIADFYAEYIMPYTKSVELSKYAKHIEERLKDMHKEYTSSSIMQHLYIGLGHTSKTLEERERAWDFRQPIHNCLDNIIHTRSYLTGSPDGKYATEEKRQAVGELLEPYLQKRRLEMYYESL
ncbi:MAG: hypothetical protein KatS3mg002_0124 [Candidatus Woesearchaeota archaeon]|nr:MAG: hypothetical protein KatS3mg002_0124 [Candidatus Woesearchaeota archaeon]